MMMYVDGELVSGEQAKVSVFDHGYMYGLGLFETFRVYNGHPFLLDDHFRRLQEGLHMLGIEWEMNRKDMSRVIDQLINANQYQDQDVYVRWNVSAGDKGLGLYTGQYTEPVTVVYTKSLPEQMGREKQGVILKTRRNTPETKVRLKSHHYLNNIMAKREIGSDPSVEGIFLTEDGYLAEGIVSNLFWVKNGIVYTPSIETGILNGITRQFVIKMLKDSGYIVNAGKYPKEELYEADEVFVTNSIQEVVSLTSIDRHTYDSKQTITRELQQRYKLYSKKLWSKIEL
ncbi:aminodeoxychorismate lyase [Alkalihalophilus marmarensis]|jgi:4-amino-4-deoxychorismate lyase|uniref:4-amino-4-deoxychorismate lyase n=1 Tax=Alkalihalophilus marmarensis DSM 21297 TaxID=1188261 RepID=U6SQ97_9BACI|nr:aminodeoxychorismate lyase [Alkalihalophilus marmarensis]ERN53552.1 4-amino-4-deoxychorismate lyase [Alkalihalophilus marmarensis DSM 21297]MCM3491473.1 aminodeoxychorismate lyase [Alkalihalophilus marmarensis]